MSNKASLQNQLQNPVVAYRVPLIWNDDDTDNLVELVYMSAFNVDLCKEMDITELNGQIPLFKKTYK